MGFRSWIGTTALGVARHTGRAVGCELEVTVDDQRISLSMSPPGARESRSWDNELYARGQMYYGDYANPIKPLANKRTDVDDKDTGTLYVSEDGDSGGETPYVKLMSSARYQIHMANEMIDSLVTPDEQWNKIFYGLVLLGILQFFSTAAGIMIATGAL